MSTAQNEITPFSEALQNSQTLALPALAKQSFHEGLESLQSGEAATAVAALSRCLEQAPDFTPAHIFVGIAHALTSNIYPAIDHLETAAQIEPHNFAALFTLAQLNFKLRIPKKGYEAAEKARQCINTLEQRKMLTHLLKEERARERNGIARPSFNKPFSLAGMILAGSSLLVVLIAIAVHMH
jgi:tetratricopeptide (TPR) repeat protein